MNRHAHTDFSATRSFLADKGLQSRICEPRARAADDRFRSEINALYGDGLYLAYMQYRVDIEIQAGAERGDYGFSVPLDGRMTSTATDMEFVACTTASTILASPGRSQRLRLARDARRLSISIEKDRIRQHLATLTGRDIKDPIIFEPMLDLKRGAGAAVLASMRLVVEQEDAGQDVFGNPLRQACFSDGVLSTLLLYHAHSHGDLLTRPAPRGASRDVKRAIDYIHANLEEPITLEVLVKVAGTPGRTLNEHFRSFTGLAPMAYLRRERLAAARQMILSGDASVTEAALRYGFCHLGRFAKAYRAAYGEPPSAAAARVRRSGMR